MLTVDIN